MSFYEYLWVFNGPNEHEGEPHHWSQGLTGLITAGKHKVNIEQTLEGSGWWLALIAPFKLSLQRMVCILSTCFTLCWCSHSSLTTFCWGSPNHMVQNILVCAAGLLQKYIIYVCVCVCMWLAGVKKLHFHGVINKIFTLKPIHVCTTDDLQRLFSSSHSSTQDLRISLWLNIIQPLRTVATSLRAISLPNSLLCGESEGPVFVSQCGKGKQMAGRGLGWSRERQLLMKWSHFSWSGQR